MSIVIPHNYKSLKDRDVFFKFGSDRRYQSCCRLALTIQETSTILKLQRESNEWLKSLANTFVLQDKSNNAC